MKYKMNEKEHPKIKKEHPIYEISLKQKLSLKEHRLFIAKKKRFG